MTLDELLEAVARALDPKAWENMPSWAYQNGFTVATAENCIRRQRKARKQAPAALSVLKSATGLTDADLEGLLAGKAWITRPDDTASHQRSFMRS